MRRPRNTCAEQVTCTPDSDHLFSSEKVPEVNSLAELNELIDLWDLQDEARRIGSRPRTIGEYFAAEQPLLRPISDEPLETGLWLSVRVDRYAQVTARTNRYSVPVRLIGRKLRVLLHASELVVYDGQEVVARHERLVTKADPAWNSTPT